MKLDVYVNYNGNCREAFRFYEQHLGGKIMSIETFRQMPDEANIPEERKDDILHARIEIGGMVLMGADIPNAEPMRSAYLTLRLDSAEEAEKIYKVLSAQGEIFMKMEETAFATRFAMLRDRFARHGCCYTSGRQWASTLLYFVTARAALVRKPRSGNPSFL